MDINQAVQMIRWLEEEHRSHKSLIIELRQKIENQTVALNHSSKRYQDFEARLVAIQAKFTHFTVLEESIKQTKDEVLQMVQEVQEEMERYQRNYNQSRQLELQNSSRAINELKRSLEAIPPLQERLNILKTEDLRLGEVLINLQAELSSYQRKMAPLPDRIHYVEGQRAQDVNLINQMQEEVVELRRRIESQIGKIELVDDIARKNEQRITSRASYGEEISKRQTTFIESVRLKEAQRDRQLQEWQTEITRFEEEMVKQRKVLERFGRQHEQVQQHLIVIDNYKQTLNREQQQVAELQRLSEERIQRELTEWIAANEQRLTKVRLEEDAQWHEQKIRHQELVNSIKELEKLHKEDVARIEQIAKQLPQIRDEYRAKIRELWSIHERAAIFHLDKVRRWYDEISATVSAKVTDI